MHPLLLFVWRGHTQTACIRDHIPVKSLIDCDTMLARDLWLRKVLKRDMSCTLAYAQYQAIDRLE